jgi:Ligand-gated ion channel
MQIFLIVDLIKVWMMSLSALILMGPLIYLIIKLRRKVLKMFGEESRNYKMSECVWFTYGAIMKQGSPLEPSDGLFLVFYAKI